MKKLAYSFLLVCFTTSLRADVIYSNLGSPAMYDSTGADTVSSGGTDYSLAFIFPVMTNDYLVNELDFFIYSTSGDDMISATLYADNGGLPGTQLYSSGFITDTDLASGNPTEVTINLAGGPVLNAGQNYWLSLDALTSSEVAWFYNYAGIDGESSTNPNGDGWTAERYRDQGAFDVIGNIAPAPEPFTGGLIASGLGALLLRRRKRQ